MTILQYCSEYEDKHVVTAVSPGAIVRLTGLLGVGYQRTVTILRDANPPYCVISLVLCGRAESAGYRSSFQ